MIKNLTQHAITLAPTPDPLTWFTFPSAGQAVLESTPGAAETVEGCPVPVMGTPTFGAITGLPESVEPGTLLVVSFPVSQRVAVERAELEGELAQLQEAISERLYGERRQEAEESVNRIQARLQVLACVVGLGTSPADKPIRWSEEDARAGACSDKQVGTPKAVTRLVRA